MKKFGEKLRSYRTVQGLKQSDLSAETGISQQRLSEYELGKIKPSAKNRKKIYDFFGVTF